MQSKSWQYVIVACGVIAAIFLVVRSLPKGDDDAPIRREPTVAPESTVAPAKPQPRQPVATLRSDELVQFRAIIAEPSKAEPPNVRIEAVRRLGLHRDYESVEPMIDMLEDEDFAIANAASDALYHTLGWKLLFDADTPPDQRAAVVEETRILWEAAKETDHYRQLRAKEKK